MTAHFIVIGNPITHSKSPEIHQAFANQVDMDICYSKQFCPDDEGSFRAVVEAFFNGGGLGANVTVPFKQIAYELCADRLTPYAQVAGAVNTLFKADGKIHGHNTDGLGLVNHFKQLGWELSNKKVAIIGAGGASRGVMLPLLSAGIAELHIANRTVSKAEKLIADCQAQVSNLSNDANNLDSLFQLTAFSFGSIEALTGRFDIIINATSIGLSGDKLPLSAGLSCQHAYDMMYGRELPFLQHFKQQGADTRDGYGMLIGQAALSFELWTGKKITINGLNI